MSTKDIVKKIGVIGIGYSVVFMISHWFDFFLYIPVVAYFGPVKGCVIMTILSMIVNLGLLWVYDRTGKDWLGLEALKDGKEGMSSKLPKYIRKAMLAGDLVAFFVLSIYDPLFAVIYMRDSANSFKGLSKKDWMVFIFSTVIANVGWTGVVYGGVILFKFLKTALF